MKCQHCEKEFSPEVFYIHQEFCSKSSEPVESFEQEQSNDSEPEFTTNPEELMEVDLETLTVKHLEAICAANGKTVKANAKKADLIEAVEALIFG